MLLHHLRVGARALARRKSFALINIGGLALGLAAALLIALFVREEWSYDRWLRHADRIVRAQGVISLPGREPFSVAAAPLPLLAFALQDLPQIEAGARLFHTRGSVQLGDRALAVPLALVDAAFFDVLALPVAAGDARAAITEPNAVAITRSAARRLLGTADALGREVTINDLGRTRTLRVLAVLQDLPANTHLMHELYTRWDQDAIERTLGDGADSWSNAFAHTYVRLRPGADKHELDAAWPAFNERRIPPDARVGDIPVRQMSSTVSIALTDLHLHSNGMGEFKPSGSAGKMRLLAAIGALVLLVAALNFVNLSTALAAEREREVALRRTLGARRPQLVAQFLVEAVLIAVLAGLAALALVEWLLPGWRTLLDRPDGMAFGLTDPMLAAFAALVIATGLGAGLYPALLLARVRPAAVLHTRSGGGSAWLRQLLVGLQFAVVIALVAGTLGVLQQGAHMGRQDLGYRSADLLFLRGGNRPDVREQAVGLMAAWRNLPGVQAVARSRDVPGNAGGGGYYLQRQAAAAGSGSVVEFAAVDDDALDVFGAQVLHGRGFQRAQALDDLTGLTAAQRAARGGHVLLSELAAQRLGFERVSDAVGQSLRWTVEGDFHVPLTVIGIVRNLRFVGPTEPLEPTFYVRDEERLNHFVLRLSPAADREAARTAVEKAWRERVPQAPIAMTSVEQVLGKDRGEQRRASWVLTLAAVLAVGIGCLGLLGLAAHQVAARSREIALRRLMGAPRWVVLRLLLWRFGQPVLLAALVACPLAAWALQQWLTRFASRVELSIWWFAAATAMALAVATAAVLMQAWRAASVRPVEALRCE